MREWEIQNSRFTVFVTPDYVPPEQLWSDLLGEPPEQSSFQRVPGIRTDLGPFADGVLTLQTLPMRIDWTLESINSPNGNLSSLGKFPGSSQLFLNLCRKWIAGGKFPATKRLALGFTLFSPTENRETGYAELGDFVEGVPKDPEARDFAYQVNFRRECRSMPELKFINRLGRWSVGMFRQFAFIGSEPLIGTPHHHLRVELDINTPNEFESVIPPESGLAVLDDLFSGGTEIIQVRRQVNE